MLKINVLQMPKVEDFGIAEGAVQIACCVAVSVQNGLYLCV